jgi:hypothetical protein
MAIRPGRDLACRAKRSGRVPSAGSGRSSDSIPAAAGQRARRAGGTPEGSGRLNEREHHSSFVVLAVWIDNHDTVPRAQHDIPLVDCEHE